MLSRLLTALLLLLQASVAQQFVTALPIDLQDTCPTTKQHQGTDFTPPLPYSVKAPEGYFYFGTDRLWTSLPADGTWRGLHDDQAYGQKISWWRQGYDWNLQPRLELVVTGKRLGDPTSVLLSWRASPSGSSREAFFMSGVNLPGAGCWEVTGHMLDETLTFVVWVTK
jgi:hypothetical protein